MHTHACMIICMYVCMYVHMQKNKVQLNIILITECRKKLDNVCLFFVHFSVYDTNQTHNYYIKLVSGMEVASPQSLGNKY